MKSSKYSESGVLSSRDIGIGEETGAASQIIAGAVNAGRLHSTGRIRSYGNGVNQEMPDSFRCSLMGFGLVDACRSVPNQAGSSPQQPGSGVPTRRGAIIPEDAHTRQLRPLLP
jgi:hypothetical protein